MVLGNDWEDAEVSFRLMVRCDVSGFHRWPDAPGDREYLRSNHHHMFKVVVEIAPGGPDRVVELHDLRLAISVIAPEVIGELPTASVETMAAGIRALLINRMKYDVRRVEVWEDSFHAGAIDVDDKS